MPISAVDAIGPAFQHSKQQLLQPFSVSQWAKLALVGFLAGELSSGGCNGGNFQVPHQTHSQQLLSGPFSGIDPALYASLLAMLIVAGVILGILFLYVSSVMRFVLFDSIVNRRCEIRKSWSARHAAGLRFFVWRIMLTLSIFVIMIILVGVPAAFAFAMGWLKDPKAHLAPLILGGIVLFFIFLAFIFASLLVEVITKDFVVPQMALENITAVEGWRRLWSSLSADKGGYAGYIGMKIVMALGAAVVLGIATFILIILMLIPVGGLGVIAVLAGKTAGLTWNLYTISAAIVLGCIALAVILYIVSFVSVPATVFFPAYSIYFFASRYAPLSTLLYPAASTTPAQETPQLIIPPPEPIG